MPKRSQVRNRQLVDDWIFHHGYNCPGYQRAPHQAHPETNRLSVDHIIPRRRGGTDDLENLQILCRACNSRKKDRRYTISTGPSFPHPLR